MAQIITEAQLNDMYMADEREDARAFLRSESEVVFGDNAGEPSVWQIREQCRMTSDHYDPVIVTGDDILRFLHISQDDPSAVAYTKNAEKGAADIQTRTTLAAYCEKFGLVNPGMGDEVQTWTDAEDMAAALDADHLEDIAATVQEYLDAVDNVTRLKKELRGLVA